jgi:two-component system chemotaxis response regulator CheB
MSNVDAGHVPVIALVGSAGAHTAVWTILAGLPQGFGASVIVLIHQEPQRRSRLAEVTDRRCGLPVANAEHDARLTPSSVVVVPSGCHLLVAPGDRTVLIVSGAVPPSRPSADLLLATMAVALGPRAIAVVLSGGGHDGATGATAIHRCGGTVIATDAASSKIDSMPRATTERDDQIDHVVAIDEVAALLVDLVRRRGE